MTLKSFTTIILIFIFFCSSTFVLCQNGIDKCINTMHDTSIYEENLTGEFYIPDEIYKGSVFFNSDWCLGTIILENNKKIIDKYINYHLFSGQLFWLRTFDYKQIIIDKETVKEFVIYPKENNAEEIFRKIKFRPWYLIDSITGYLQVLAEGNINLYAFRKASLDKNSNELSLEVEYYIQLNKGTIKHLKPGRWSLYAAIKENKPLIKKIVRSNHFRIRREEDLIKAIKIFNLEIIATNN